MKETKIELVDRLRREGRWEEANLFKDETIKELRSSGKTKFEAGEEAWNRTEEKYPPLPETELPSKESKAEIITETGPILWDDLPASAPFDVEVIWAHGQFIVAVEETPKGNVIHWDRLTEKPPSQGARAWLRFAARNDAKFHGDIVPKAMSAASAAGDEEGLVREEKRSIAEVQKIIEKMSS